MTFKEYQVNAQRTCADLGSLKANIAHMALGIASENEEFLKAMVNNDMVNAREEQADICWYVANWCNLRNFDMEEIAEGMNSSFDYLEDCENNVSMFEIHASRLADYAKKFLAYDKPMETHLEKKSLSAVLASLAIEDTGFNFEVDLAKNIAKLKKRYPGKFTNEDAINRDLEAERKILEA